MAAERGAVGARCACAAGNASAARFAAVTRAAVRVEKGRSALHVAAVHAEASKHAVHVPSATLGQTASQPLLVSPSVLTWPTPREAVVRVDASEHVVHVPSATLGQPDMGDGGDLLASHLAAVTRCAERVEVASVAIASRTREAIGAGSAGDGGDALSPHLAAVTRRRRPCCLVDGLIGKPRASRPGP